MSFDRLLEREFPDAKSKAELESRVAEIRAAAEQEQICQDCGHGAYRHRQRMSDADPAPCGACACEDFTLGEFDNFEGEFKAGKPWPSDRWEDS